MEDFSLIILCRSRFHLLPMTLDTLKTQQGSFEVIVLDGEVGRLIELAKSYPDLNFRWKTTASPLSTMMNKAVQMAKGRYIQFLQPGDRYISQYGIHFLTEQIKTHPPLIMARGIAPEASTYWFSKEKILELGGFDERLLFCPLQDLLYRFQMKGIKPLVCRRAIVDSKTDPIGSVRETCKILYRHFGLLHVLKWIFVDRSPSFRRVRSLIKEAFWEKEEV